MANITQSLSTKVDKLTGKSEILLRFYTGSRINQRAKSNIFIHQSYWNTKDNHIMIPRFRIMNDAQKQLVEELRLCDVMLSNLKQYITNAFYELGAGKVELPSDWLKSTIKQFYNISAESTQTEGEEPDDAQSASNFFDVYNDFVEKTDISEARKRHYRVVYRALKRFEAYNKIHLTVGNFTAETVKNFENYLMNEYNLYKTKKLDKVLKMYPESREIHQRGRNYINGMMKKIRTFCNYASGRKKELPLDNPYMTKNPFDSYSVSAETPLGTPYFLTIEERNKLYNTQFASARMARQRDIFIFRCLIGCRVGDLMRLTWDNIVGDDLHYIPAKTCDNNPSTTSIPLHPIAKEIIERYKDEKRRSLLPFVAKQQYNEDIKEMLKLADITRNVVIIDPKTGHEVIRHINEIASSHMARRTFVGNLYNKVKDPNLIGSLSGHVNGSKAFARYRAINREAKKELVSMLD